MYKSKTNKEKEKKTPKNEKKNLFHKTNLGTCY